MLRNLNILLTCDKATVCVLGELQEKVWSMPQLLEATIRSRSHVNQLRLIFEVSRGALISLTARRVVLLLTWH